MSGCAFDLDHYAELLDAAQAGGYRLAPFDHHPTAGDVFLRHDVDLSLGAALQVARLEHERGATATYFLMTESVFYNLASPAGRGAEGELRAPGRAVGSPAAHPRTSREVRFARVLAWHNPDPESVFEPVDDFVNVMQSP